MNYLACILFVVLVLSGCYADPVKEQDKPECSDPAKIISISKDICPDRMWDEECSFCFNHTADYEMAPYRILATVNLTDFVFYNRSYLEYDSRQYIIWLGNSELGKMQCRCKTSCDPDTGCYFSFSDSHCPGCTGFDDKGYYFSIPDQILSYIMQTNLSNDKSYIDFPEGYSEYLKGGKYTRTDGCIKNLADEIPEGATNTETIQNILDYTYDRCNLFSERKECCDGDPLDISAETLIQRGACCGCSQYANVFAALARAKGFPTLYVHTISKISRDSFIQCKKPSGKIIGHMFADVFNGTDWIEVDPANKVIIREVYPNRYDSVSCPYYNSGTGGCDVEVIGKGLDNDNILFQKSYEEAYCTKYCFGKPLSFQVDNIYSDGKCNLQYRDQAS